jgi:hypothetical protein
MNPNPAGSAPNSMLWGATKAALKGIRNEAAPALWGATKAVASGIHRYGTPIAREATYATGRGIRNYAYPVIRNCVGAACSRATRRIGNAGAAGRNLGIAAAAAGRNAVAVAATRVLARLDWVNNFDNGLAITPRDRAVVQGIIDRRTRGGDPNIIANYIAQLVENVAGRVSDLITDTNADATVEYFRSLAEGEFSAELKSLYMLHLASMGRFDEIEQPSVSTAAHILAQAYYLNVNDVMFDNADDEEFSVALRGFQAGGGRRNRRKSRKSRKLRKSRKSHKHGRR